MSIEAIRDALDALEREHRALSDELEGYQMAIRDDTMLENEVKLLRSFIVDVRLGLRDLSEYEAICGPVYR